MLVIWIKTRCVDQRNDNVTKTAAYGVSREEYSVSGSTSGRGDRDREGIKQFVGV